MARDDCNVVTQRISPARSRERTVPGAGAEQSHVVKSAKPGNERFLLSFKGRTRSAPASEHPAGNFEFCCSLRQLPGYLPDI